MDLPAFLSNPLVQALAPINAWSISDKDKRPLDIFELETYGKVVGCNPEVPGATVTLNHLLELVPNPPNLAFFLNVDEHGYVCLDVEKTCSSELKTAFVAMDFVYGETSLSGKGLHLWFPTPQNINKFVDVMYKIKLRESRGNYELLMRSHWVTFTGNQITSSHLEGAPSIEQVYAFLAKETPKTSPKIATAVEEICDNLDEIPDIDYIMDLLLNKNPFMKMPEDYPDDNNATRCDMSRYEYAYLCSRYDLLRKILKLSRIQSNGHVYTIDERWAILLECATSYLEHRDKHDEMRCGMPYLVYNTRSVLMNCMTQDEADEIEAALSNVEDRHEQ